MDVSLRTLPGALLGTGSHGYRVDWAAVEEHLRDQPEHLLDATYGQLASEWVLSLAEAWGPQFRVYQSVHFLLVSSRTEKIAVNLLRLGERTSAWLQEALPGIASHWGPGKHVCLVADTQDRYYDYVSHFYPEGEFGASGGVFLAQCGYAHFLLNHAEPWQQEVTFVHEFTHALLLPRDLPVWLEEGLTQAAEATVLGHYPGDLNRDEVARHHSFWAAEGLTDYWTGESFQRADEGQELSYGLSRVLLRNLVSRGQAKFLDFLKQARSQDSGAAACRAVYGFTLADLCGQFLGPGYWGPPESYEAESDKAESDEAAR